jgi:CHAT domain-containing protein
VSLVAGPDLAYAEDEVRALGKIHRNAARYVSERATVNRVHRAIDGAGIVHIAAHGRFRADNPSFSSVRLADGPRTAHELERLTTPPRLMVLSACDTGLSSVNPGEELMGFMSAVLRSGSAAVVASVSPVPDDVAQETMVGFHRRLRTGSTVAVALADAQREVSDPSARSFICFGSSRTTATPSA